MKPTDIGLTWILIAVLAWVLALTVPAFAAGEPKVYEKSLNGVPALVIDAEISHAPGCLLQTTDLVAASTFYSWLIGEIDDKTYVTTMSAALVDSGIFGPLVAREFAKEGIKLCQRPPV
jgi:hypothetical protein